MSGGWCDHCQNTGELDCYCGGDQCVCDNNGTYPCPHCDGESGGPDGGDYPFDDENMSGMAGIIVGVLG